MAEKKQHTIVAADTSGEKKTAVHAAPVGNAGGLRAGAIILWIVGFIMEVLAGLIALGKINLKIMPTLWQLIIFLVLDLVCVIIGSQLWKKANRIKPASKKNKTKFWFWNNMGVIACVIDFLPIIIVMLSSKDLDKKTKAIATVVAIIALLIGGVASYDFDPVSLEEQQAAIAAISADVYWAPFGKVYHTHEDCGALNQTDTLTYGTVEEAIAANRTRLCSFCARRDSIEGVRTDDAEVEDFYDVTEKETPADTAADTVDTAA
ncbi:MAG: hypothetical protein MJ175_10395 [Clostridia bacterium]|nr:hypothetical protein [Clostridia bacterium]